MGFKCYSFWYGNFLARVNEAVTASDFDSFCVTVPTDPRLPGGGGNELCGFFDVDPTKFGHVRNLATQASAYGDQQECSTESTSASLPVSGRSASCRAA